MRLWILLILTCLATSGILAKGPTYFKVTARNGDGVYSMLRRYQLLDHTDNVRKFYEINGLPHNAQLNKGQTYRLPVLIYEYDGQSIRSTIGVDNWDLAVRISQWNKQLTKAGLRTQEYEENKELWVPLHEVLSTSLAPPSPEEADLEAAKFASVSGNDETSDEGKSVAKAAVNSARSLPEMLHVPLFGKDHADIEMQSHDLTGKVFYLVSGHGGPDPGAISDYNGNQLCEDEYAYDVTLRLARRLMENGAIVEVIVQDPDDGIRSSAILECDQEELSLGEQKIPLWQKARLQQRTHAINQLHKNYRKAGLNDHTVVCIHVDSRHPNRTQDVFFYYYDESKAGRELAFKLQGVFKEKYEKNRPQRSYRGTVSSRSLYVLRFTDPTAVYVELANIRNASDRKRILPESNRQALANWLYEGLTR